MEELLRDIDEATEPKVMSRERAKQFLENLHMEIGLRIDGVEDDIANED